MGSGVMLETESEPSVPSVDLGWLEPLFADKYAEMVRVASLLTGNRPMAEDLVQDAFVSLARLPEPLDDPSAAGGYLLRTVVNACRSQHRRAKVERRHDRVTATLRQSAEATAMVQEDARVVSEALGQLPTRQRACVVCRYHLGLSPPEIAAALEISENSVKTHLRRALKRLAMLMKENR